MSEVLPVLYYYLHTGKYNNRTSAFLAIRSMKFQIVKETIWVKSRIFNSVDVAVNMSHC